jgi:hypothetical protein
MPFPFLSALRPRRRAVAAWAALALAAGCGGGTAPIERFVPSRIIAFGDEMSALTANGQNYTINGTNNNGTPDDASDDRIDCGLQANWVQALALVWGYVFPQCNNRNVDAPQGVMHAAPGADVAAVEVQLQAQVDAGGFQEKDLATVLVGVNDVLALYGQYVAGADTAPLLSAARERGRRAARVVNDLVARGAKVVLVNMPDMGLSPYAFAQRAAFPDGIDRAALLSELSSAFNQEMGLNVLLDGRYIALVQGDDITKSMARSPLTYLLTNTTEAACAVAPPDCSNLTLVTNATPANHLWASDRWLGFAAQNQIALLATVRVTRNPF